MRIRAYIFILSSYCYSDPVLMLFLLESDLKFYRSEHFLLCAGISRNANIFLLLLSEMLCDIGTQIALLTELSVAE